MTKRNKVTFDRDESETAHCGDYLVSSNGAGYSLMKYNPADPYNCHHIIDYDYEDHGLAIKTLERLGQSS